MKAKTVRIGSIDYEIVKKKDIAHPDSGASDGAIFFRKCEIHLWAQLSKQKQFEVFMHECLHGLVETAKINIKDAAEEKMVRSLAPLLTSFLKDNWRLLQRMGELE